MAKYPDVQPISVFVSRRVKPGNEAAFEQVISGIIEAASAFEGYLVAHVFRPSDSADPEYRLLLQFDCLSSLHLWEQSSIRQQWLERADRLALDPPKIQIITGLETWFTLSTQGAIIPPPRYKMVILTGLAIFPITTIINLAFGSLLGALHPILRSLLTTILLGTLMTYVVMPRMTYLFERWLYPKPKHRIFN